mmetsp:Transcript_124678/g.323906  ORF Transcript_124678/g.323906 Transcript_124678/m.323906 type:complete len:213 (-) Transcript_124678:125-763(-)
MRRPSARRRRSPTANFLLAPCRRAKDSAAVLRTATCRPRQASLCQHLFRQLLGQGCPASRCPLTAARKMVLLAGESLLRFRAARRLLTSAGLLLVAIPHYGLVRRHSRTTQQNYQLYTLRSAGWLHMWPVERMSVSGMIVLMRLGLQLVCSNPPPISAWCWPCGPRLLKSLHEFCGIRLLHTPATPLTNTPMPLPSSAAPAPTVVPWSLGIG